MAKLYGVGVGPGDPELLTIKAVNIISNCDTIAVPDKGVGEKTAMNIVREYIGNKDILYCETPMIRDKTKLEAYYDKIANDICTLLSEGKQVAFITLGDPTVYSTYIYVHRRVKDMGYEAEIIPGVPSFCAAAAKLGMPLCEGSERLLIVPASFDAEDALDIRANKVFMKAGRGVHELKDKLRAKGVLHKSSLVRNCGMDGEGVWQNIEDADNETGYFSIVITKDGE